MQGFTVDGERDDGDVVKKCVEVVHPDKSGDRIIQGVVVKDMTIKYCL